MSTPKLAKASAHGKCILGGEHTVLRGGPALVLPLRNRNITLTYDPNEKINILTDTEPEDILSLLFWKTLESALLNIDKDIFDLHGAFTFNNSIPIGAGLGFSAALCVAIARFLVYKGWIASDKVFHFAHELEHMFHGKSSGADVAGAMSDYPVHYEYNKPSKELKPHWQPKLYLSYSGMVKNTSIAIHEVSLISQNQPLKAAAIDKQMKMSVLAMEAALTDKSNDGLPLLVEAIKQANNCFMQWGLVPTELQKKIDQIYSLGALAVKPTGAGSGGYLLSLWADKPQPVEDLTFEAVFENRQGGLVAIFAT